MEKIVKYKSKDGREFVTEAECIEYEKLIDRVDKIMARLQPLPKDGSCDFANGHGFIQHDMQVLMGVWNDLLDEFKTEIKHKWIKESKDMKAHTSYIGRLVGDYGIAPYYKAWSRMSNIDIKTGREFGQPYYANNPDKAELFEIKEV